MMLLEMIALDIVFCHLISFVEGWFNSPYDSRRENQIRSADLISPLWDGGWKKMKNCRKWKNTFGFLFTGVAEQFALAEAAMNVWSMNDGIDQPSTSLQGLKLIQPECYCTVNGKFIQANGSDISVEPTRDLFNKSPFPLGAESDEQHW